MKGRPQDYMDVGILHFMAFPEVMKGEGPVLETLRMICEDDYFQVVEVTQIKDASVRKSAIETVRKAEMKAAFGAQPVLLGGGLDLNASEPAERQKALDAVKESIEEAREWHCTGLAVLSGKDPGAGTAPGLPFSAGKTPARNNVTSRKRCLWPPLRSSATMRGATPTCLFSSKHSTACRTGRTVSSDRPTKPR